VAEKSEKRGVRARVASDPDPLLSKYGWLKKSVGWSELLYCALFLLYLAFVLVMIMYDTHTPPHTRHRTHRTRATAHTTAHALPHTRHRTHDGTRRWD
jgi:membrane-associated HD superfamily phosphohydrolase